MVVACVDSMLGVNQSQCPQHTELACTASGRVQFLPQFDPTPVRPLHWAPGTAMRSRMLFPNNVHMHGCVRKEIDSVTNSQLPGNCHWTDVVCSASDLLAVLSAIGSRTPEPVFMHLGRIATQGRARAIWGTASQSTTTLQHCFRHLGVSAMAAGKGEAQLHGCNWLKPWHYALNGSLLNHSTSPQVRRMPRWPDSATQRVPSHTQG